MTTLDVRTLLEAHGWRVAHIAESEARAIYSEREVYLYRSISGWWAVAAQRGHLDSKPQRVGAYNEPERHVRSLSDWLREQIKEAAA